MQQVIEDDHAGGVRAYLVPSGHIVDGLTEKVGFGVSHGEVGIERWIEFVFENKIRIHRNTNPVNWKNTVTYNFDGYVNPCTPPLFPFLTVRKRLYNGNLSQLIDSQKKIYSPN